MGLPEYNKKRRFNNTPEPKGEKTRTSAGGLQFVIQKHKASHLHYDFRLELGGVLKSWAVPKGLSLDPSLKRLAVMVEDHPYTYKDFEGIIPKGNYGAGTVIVWDHGIYVPVGTKSNTKEGFERFIRGKLQKGELRFILNGEKVKGEFALVRNQNAQQDNAWLLFKIKDEFASKSDITQQDYSVVSGRTIEEVAEAPKHIWTSHKKSSTSKSIKSKKKDLPLPIPEQGKKSPKPATTTPMLATLSDKPFDDPEWIYEIKWDGYRAIADINNGKAALTSRKKISLDKFYPIVKALEKLPFNAVLDGEIVVLNEDGLASFQLLQQWTKEEKGKLCYMVFDLLWYEGYDLTNMPLTRRKELLKKILLQSEAIKYCDHVVESGLAFYDLSIKAGIEGIIAKKADSTYKLGLRSKDWLKLKSNHIQEAVITGFTQGRNSRKYLGALILGEYRRGELIYIGHTGSGMDEKTVKSVYKKLQPLITDKHPFSKKPKTNMPATWVKPELICEVKYQERTKDGILRIPIFLSLREDKSLGELIEEAKYLEEKKHTVKKKTVKQKEKTDKVKTIPSDKQQTTLTINKKKLKLTNLDKLYWKHEEISKRDVLNYYLEVMPYILPYMKDRPQSLNRHPNGIEGKSFYQKDVKGKVADWVDKYKYISESDNEEKEFLVCTDEAALLYMANLGCIEMNPWHSRIQTPENPDWCVIDLDPDNIEFEKVIETAIVVKETLDSVRAESYVKTSGSTGIHIYIPLGAKYSYDQSRIFAEIIVNMVHRKIPAFTSIERSPSKRKGMIYLDYLQNRHIQTIAAPYSLRPKPGATVSAPLDWTEVKKGLKMEQFNINNIVARIKSEGDLFQGVLGKGVDLEKILVHLNV